MPPPPHSKKGGPSEMQLNGRKGGGHSETVSITCIKSIYQPCGLAETLTVISFAHSNSAYRVLIINASDWVSGIFVKRVNKNRSI